MIAVRQSVDPLVWKDLTGMMHMLRAFQARKLSKRPYTPPSPEQIAAFLKEEETEARKA